MVRLFVAIDLPEDVRDRLAGLCNGLPGARWVPPENMHVTLRFIGEVPDGDLPDIGDALDRVRAPAFPISLAGVGYFGSRRRVHALWAGVEKSPTLVDLQRKTESALQRAGLPPEERKFMPHVTLARLKDVKTERLGPWIEARNLFRAPPTIVTRFVLFSSFLSADGAIYQPEAEFPLQNS